MWIFGVQTPLQRYPTTALGASEMSLLELATAYRTIASGVLTQPYVIRRIVRDSGDVVPHTIPASQPVSRADGALALIQEGLRGVVRIPTGTAHALDSSAFPIAVMGKTGTTNEFRDALFVGSTYGDEGITVAVRIGFDDNRSLGAKETGARVALPVFQELMLRVYQEGLVGTAPAFPNQMEQHITRYLQGEIPPALPLDQVLVGFATGVALRGRVGSQRSRQSWCLRSDCQLIHDSPHAFGFSRNRRRSGTARRSHHGALQRHHVLAGIDVDIAVLQQFLADEALIDPGGDPRIGHHFARLAQAILGFIRHDLRALDDRVFRLLRALLGFLDHGLIRERGAPNNVCWRDRQESE